MNSADLTQEYIIAEGPEGLKTALEALYAKASLDPVFAASEHYILYQLGDQRSLIKVETEEEPYQFWYNDLLGRPATKVVKDIIADFLWEKFGDGVLTKNEEKHQ